MTEDIMTDKQAKTIEILARIDELDRLSEVLTDPQAKAKIEQRKTALREQLNEL